MAQLIGRIAPDLPRHGSTQMSVHTLQGALELKELGFTRVVLARMYGQKQRQTSSFDPVSALMMRGNIRCFSREPMTPAGIATGSLPIRDIPLSSLT